MIYAVVQVILKLFFDPLCGIADTCKMCDRYGTGILDHFAHIHVLAHIGSARTVCTGNVLRPVLAKMLNGSRKIFHSFVCLRREQLKRNEHFVPHCLR